MQVSDFDYVLPAELIANTPPEVRGTSRLLVVHRSNEKLEDAKYGDIVNYLNAGDVLVLNDTRVIKARLKVTKVNGASRELIVLERHSADTDWHKHKVMYRRKLTVGDKLTIGDAEIIVEEIVGQGIAVVSSSHDLLQLAEKYGSVPLPPYMHRDANDIDIERYQTVWAEQQGSVAAPTASLNMTDEILDRLRAKGVIIKTITLHVGLGTFLPIRVDELDKHTMHQEYFKIPKSTVEAIQHVKQNGNKVIALGTTVARTLEYAAEQLQQPAMDLKGEADIFIYPGYKFKTVDGLLTNYHAPKSTVLMLTAAFAGWPLLAQAYAHAISERYQFLSYGDSMIIL
ncbi:MAG TPA: tRNA preQ1(34) S-adenosylmethionine ribosyltransferase-isomerase QueA [Candidatus Saccharimonadales bacterium]|jgi:S-adenosylmethionine:tRNA ribosyltransferase-isomerase